LQLIPRQIWRDHTEKQLLQWPIEELETLREKNVNLSNQVLNKGDKVEVEGITAAQVCNDS
jgi:beta-fructofuranosidase